MSDLSRFILGTAQLGLNYGINNKSGKPDMSQASRIIKKATELGVQYLDTADVYGDSQKVLGEIGVKDFRITSKFIFENANEKFSDKLRHSLATLRVESIWGYFFHRFNQYEEFNGWEEVEEVKKAGLIQKLGVSVYDNMQLEKAVYDNKIDLIQLPFNVLDNWQRRGELLLEAARMKKTIHVRSIYLQGLLLMDINSLPNALETLIKPLQEIQQIAKEENCSVAQLCLAYALYHNQIEGVVIGLENPEQLEQNVRAFDNLSIKLSTVERINQIKVADVELLNPGNWKLA